MNLFEVKRMMERNDFAGLKNPDYEDSGDAKLYGDSPSESMFDDPGDAKLYGDSKTSNYDSKFMEYLGTLKSDNEKDNKVIEAIMTNYNDFMIKDWKHKYIQAAHEQDVEAIKAWEREYFRQAQERNVAAYCNRYSYMFKENEEEADSNKVPTEMTLLEKLSQRSDAGLLADKFTNFLKTTGLQK